MALPIIIDGKVLATGGEGDYYQLDVIKDVEGFGEPAKTLLIENLGTGGGTDSIYFQLGDSDGRWTNIKTVAKSESIVFGADDGIEYKIIKIWASDAGGSFSLIVTKGR